MRQIRTLILSLTLIFCTTISTVYAEQPALPFVETAKVYLNLLENHISKPQEKQLVQGALKLVSEEAEKQKKQLTVSADDDTYPEMESRLREWQTSYRIDEKTLNVWAIHGMLKTLDDPHTSFFTREELRRFQAGVENQLVGFGFRLRLQDGALVIREIVPQSPAAAVDLQKGDKLLAVDGLSLQGKSFEEAFALLKGEEESEAVLTVYKTAFKQEKKITLKRAYLSIPEVEGMRFVGNGIGYISFDTFGSDGAYQFRDKLAEFLKEKQPLQGLVIDLRDNGGGYLTTAGDIASLFMEDGLLMYTTDRNGVEIKTWVRNGRSITYPVRILVNEGTASASELLSGALRDHGIAKLVGAKTYGKGSAQQVIPLIDGDALKITLHEYFTPKHTVVNHVGLEPDFAVEDYISQVISALQSLGVKKFELSESAGEVKVNGVSFSTVNPMFQKNTSGLSIHNAVLAQLLNDSSINKEGYSLLASYQQRYKNFVVRQVDSETIALTIH